MKRNAGPILSIFFVLALFAGFTWLTRHPESPWLEKAQEWPWVGDLATRFRDAYVHQEPAGNTTAEETGGKRETVVVYIPAKPGEPLHLPPYGPPAATGDTARRPPPSRPAPPPREPAIPRLSPADRRAPAVASAPPISTVQYVALEWVWFLPGNRIFAAADSDAEVRTRLEAMAYLPVLDRDGNWVEVMYDGRRGWIDTFWKPPHDRRKARRGILRQRYEPVRGSDGVKLRKARKILGVRRSDVKVGDYSLVTDVDDEELLAFLDSAAVAAEEAYFARYGRLPSGDPLRSAVLFAAEADYRRFTEATSSLPADGFVGHAGSGVLAFYAEGRSRVALARTLVHEITHLLNDRAVARRLQPWLEEGMATDLGSVWVESSPDVESDPIVGDENALVVQGLEPRIFFLERLLEAGKLPSVAAVVSLDRDDFYRPEVKTYSYAHSAALIRYLLEGEDGRLAGAFHTFLKRVATGLRADLLKLLERDVEELDRGFREWLREEARECRERLQERAERSWSAARRRAAIH